MTTNLPSRRPTVNTNRRPSVGYASPSTASPTGRSSGVDEDDSLWLREKEKEDISIGRAGAVERGVTKPKRRLSRYVTECKPVNGHLIASLPSLAHPFHNNNRSPNPSPPVTPVGTGDKTFYQALQKPLSGAPSYKATKIDQTMAAKEGAPTLWGIELKWIS